jgi:hypothetical protein
MRLVRVNERQIGTVAWRLGEKTALYATALPSFWRQQTSTSFPQYYQSNIYEQRAINSRYTPIVLVKMVY